jgi:flagellar biosynthesis protein FliQ
MHALVPMLSDTSIIEIATNAMVVALKLSAPFLGTALCIGFVVSLFQSMTQIQEATLAFVPKVLGIGVALLFCGNWMLHTMVTYTEQLWSSIPSLLS